MERLGAMTEISMLVGIETSGLARAVPDPVLDFAFRLREDGESWAAPSVETNSSMSKHSRELSTLSVGNGFGFNLEPGGRPRGRGGIITFFSERG